MEPLGAVMKSSHAWVLGAIALAAQIIAVGACGSSNNAPAPMPDAGSYVTNTDASSTSSSSAYSVPSNMLPGPVTVVYPDGSSPVVDAGGAHDDAAAPVDSGAADATGQ
jgi:hypothetical protein